MAARRQVCLLSLQQIAVINLTCCVMNPGADFELTTLELCNTLNQALTILNPRNGDLEAFVFVQGKGGKSCGLYFKSTERRASESCAEERWPYAIYLAEI